MGLSFAPASAQLVQGQPSMNIVPAYVSGTRLFGCSYPMLDSGTNYGTVTPGSGVVFYAPFTPLRTVAVSKISIYVATAVGNIVAGVYNDNSGTPQGGTLIANSSVTSIAVAGANAYQDLTPAGAFTLTFGLLYWFAFSLSSGAAIFYGMVAKGAVWQLITGDVTGVADQFVGYQQRTRAFATLENTVGTLDSVPWTMKRWPLMFMPS